MLVLCRMATGKRAYRGPRGLVIRDDDSAAGCEGFAQMRPSGEDLWGMSGSAGIPERLFSVVAHASDWTGTALPTPVAASWVLAWAAGGWLRAYRQDLESLRGESTAACRAPEGHATSTLKACKARQDTG